MGFDRVIARKALKATGDVSNAVTFLLESANLDGLSDSEEVVSNNAKENEDAKAKEEAELKKIEEEKKKRQENLVSVQDFKLFVKIAQTKGLDTVTDWSTFSPEQAKYLPFKTKKKYTKLFD
jgi:hypothetical protein